MKRVYCLYRVSTLGQVEKEDIPMQREACREFAKAKGWSITEEFSEKGVSGFTVSSDDREALQTIKKAAIQKRFDVLLVFMFDRIGRRHDETPFVVEWFVTNGIEVWSVVEGEQRFEDHVDKLLNYIRYWQSSGENIKTSIRTKARMEQLTKQGIYTGGTVAYGYQARKLGRNNKRGHEVHDVIIEPNEALVVKEIFRLYSTGIMGTYRIAVHLTDQGILNRSGKAWNSGTILNMIKNERYTGVLKFGNTVSDSFSHLRIVDVKTFQAAQRKVAENKILRPRKPGSKMKSLALAADILYCMHCGKRMIVTSNIKTYTNKKGERKVYHRNRYFCSSRRVCSGQKGYSIKRADIGLLALLNNILSDIRFSPIYQDTLIEEKITDQKHALSHEERMLADLEREVVQVIRGTSAFGSVLLNELICKAQRNIADIRSQIEQLQDERRNQQIQRDRVVAIQKMLRGGEHSCFTLLPLPQQQSILYELVKKIEIGTGYQYRIEWAFGGITEGIFEDTITNPSN